MNPHQVLGVESGATKEEIKSAYRKLAMQYHPDRAEKTDENVAKFHQIQEAYDMLTKPQQNRQQHQQRQRHPFEDSPFGWAFSQGFGNGFGNAAPMNHDLQTIGRIALEQAYHGCELSISLPDKILTINVPKGVQHGQRLKVDGEGSKELQNAPPGDLYIIIEIQPHPMFQYGGINLQTVARIDMLDLILGCDLDVTTITGEKIKVTVPKGTLPHNKLRVSGKGMPLPQGDRFGDLFVAIEPVMPPLPDAQIKKLKQVRKSY